MFVTFIFLYKLIIAVLFAIVFFQLIRTSKLGRQVKFDPSLEPDHVGTGTVTYIIMIAAVGLTEGLACINGRHHSLLKTIHLVFCAFPFLITFTLLFLRKWEKMRKWFPFIDNKRVHRTLASFCLVFCFFMNITGDLLLFLPQIARQY